MGGLVRRRSLPGAAVGGLCVAQGGNCFAASIQRRMRL